LDTRGYRELVAWQKAMDLVELVYMATQSWPREELYVLTAQIRRAAVSVPSNIAEGHGRVSTGEYVSHIGIAYGSLMEVETQAEIAGRLGYLSPNSGRRIRELSAEVGRMLNGLKASLTRRN
jgi:four helix bundle protein